MPAYNTHILLNEKKKKLLNFRKINKIKEINCTSLRLKFLNNFIVNELLNIIEQRKFKMAVAKV